MLFKRRKKRLLGDKLKSFVWPQMGLRRFFEYLKLRVIRFNDSPHKIALGLAFGMGASFNPFFGTHILQALFLTFIFRANYPAAVIGTVVGNPFTFPAFAYAAMSAGGLFVDGSWAWVIGGYMIAPFVIVAGYFICLPLVKGMKLARAKWLVRIKRDAE